MTLLNGGLNATKTAQSNSSMKIPNCTWWNQVCFTTPNEFALVAFVGITKILVRRLHNSIPRLNSNNMCMSSLNSIYCQIIRFSPEVNCLPNHILKMLIHHLLPSTQQYYVSCLVYGDQAHFWSDVYQKSRICMAWHNLRFLLISMLNFF